MVRTKILPINGGMDKDSSLLNIDSDSGTVLERRNCRSRSSRGGRAGANVPMKGMEEITSFMPSGTNEVIGYVEDKKRDGGIFLVWNSLSKHSIFRFIASTNIVEKVLFEESGLGFSRVNIDASITGDFLIWTDGIDIQKMINVDRAYNYTNGISVDWKDTYQEINEETISFAKRTPMEIPDGDFITDLDVKTNNIQGSLFQFAYQYVYKDSEASPVGSYSKLYAHPSVIAFSGAQTSSSFANGISFELLNNNTEVTKIRLLARDSNTNPWFIAYELEKGSSTSMASESFTFYNDSVRKYLTTEDSTALNAGVPISSDAVEVVGNRVFLGGNKYDEVKPTDISITATVESERYNANNFIDEVFINWDRTTSGRDTGFDVTIPVVSEGDLVSISIGAVVEIECYGTDGKEDDFISYNKGAFDTEYIVKAGEDRNDVRDFLVSELGTLSNYFFYDFVYSNEKTNNPDDIEIEWNISATSTGTGALRVNISVETSDSIDKLEINEVEVDDTTSIVYKSIDSDNQFKQTFLNNSLYSIGVKYMNDFGYTNGVVAETGVAIDNAFTSTGYDWDVDTSYDISVIRCDLSGTPPSWATKYQFVYSKSLSYSAVFDFPSAIQSSKVDFEGRQVSAIEIPSDVNYSFVEGDFVNTDFLNTGSTRYSGVKVVGQTSLITVTATDEDSESSIETKTIAGNFILLDGAANPKLFNEIELIIYRPIDSSDDIIYYENPVIHNIISGIHQETSVVLNGDAWIAPRSFQIISPNDDTTSERFFSKKRSVWVQDFFINKRYGLKGYSQGKPIVAIDNVSTDVQAAISYGGKYFEDTEVNNISNFYGNIKQSLSESDGEITGMELVGDVLKAIQYNKETSLYIGKQQITNADGSLQLVATSSVIGTSNPSLEDYGTRYPQSVCKFNRNLYYFDSDRGEFIRSSPNGQIAISDYGMRSYFSQKKDELLTAKSLSQTNNVKCGFDVEHGELVVSFFIGNVVESLTFVEGKNEWNQFVDYRQISIGGNATGACRYGSIGDIFISFKDDSLYVHEATENYNEFYGAVQAMSITGVLNDAPIEDKHLKELSIDSTTTYAVKITTPIASTRPVGHKTVLREGSFRGRQGNYVSPILRNIRVASGSDDMSLIYSGDRVVGKYAEIRLTKTPSSDFYLYDIGVSYLIQK